MNLPNFTKLSDAWLVSYNDSISLISEYLTDAESDGIDEQKFKKLANWLMELDENPYGYLPENWASFRDNPFTCLDFLRNIHHAMTDDGDVAFVTVKIDNRIIAVRLEFLDHHDIETIKQAPAISDLISTYTRSNAMMNRIRVQTNKPEVELIFDITATYDSVKFMNDMKSHYNLNSELN